MINESLEKKINKLDGDIEALGRAKYYLSNKDEINDVIDRLNKERQIHADEIYLGDGNAYRDLIERIEELIDKELGRDEQVDLLEEIKERFGRRAANVTKKNYGLNAWLKYMDVDCNWIENENSEWATLVITGYTPKTNN